MKSVFESIHLTLRGSSLHKFYGMKDILKRPSRPAGNNLRPHFLGNSIAWVQKTPVRARLRLDPLEVFDLAPAVFVIWAIMIKGLFTISIAIGLIMEKLTYAFGILPKRTLEQSSIMGLLEQLR